MCLKLSRIIIQAHTAFPGSVGLLFFVYKETAATGTDASSHYLNAITSLGVQPMILHSFSKVSIVMFRFFLRESSV